MQKRHVLWGRIDPDEGVLVAIEMNDTNYKVKIHTFMKKGLGIDFIKNTTEEWVKNDSELDLTNVKETIERDLSEDSLLPDHIRADRPGIVREIQNEWAYALLTNKLWESFLTELEQIKEEAANISSYDRNLFNKCKSFWERILDHKKERNINQERLDQIKEDLNVVFDKLKELRISEAAEFEQKSAEFRAELEKEMAGLKEKIEGMDTSKAMFESLKQMRPKILKAKLAKEHRDAMNKMLDNLFNLIKANRNKAFSSRLGKRISDLEGVAAKMQRSIDFDKKEWDFQNRKMERGNSSQLEMQLRKAKMNMLQDKIKSKEEKLKGIQNTLSELKRKSEKVEKEDLKAKTAAGPDAKILDTPAKEDKPVEEAKAAENTEAKEQKPEAGNETPGETSNTAEKEAAAESNEAATKEAKAESDVEEKTAAPAEAETKTEPVAEEKAEEAAAEPEPTPSDNGVEEVAEANKEATEEPVAEEKTEGEG